MKIKNIKYSPILKTTQAEIKGYEKLAPEIKEKILPLFELTRGRRSKHDRFGDISKQVNKIFEVSDGNRFILDLTTESFLSNLQIDRMLTSHSNGYKVWCSYVKEIYQDNLIPIIHFNEKASIEDNNKQLEKLSDVSDVLAFRLYAEDSSVLDKFENINQHGISEIIYILDMGYVFNDTISPSIINNIKTILEKYNPYKIFVSSSSFPKNATEVAENGNNDEGSANLTEVQMFDEISKRVDDNKVSYGDYACIHPKRIQQAGARGWYPRIDYPLENRWFYQRNPSRDYNIGYINIANRVVSDERYLPIENYECWGDNEVISAAKGSPNGRSPVHWIAVRANIHMTRQCVRLY